MFGNKSALAAFSIALTLLGAGCARPEPPAAPSQTKTAMTSVSYYLVALDASPAHKDETETETFGCNDKLAMVRAIAEAGPSNLELALNRLLTVSEDEAGELGLYTPLAGRGLRAEVADEAGVTVVNIVGQLTSGGVCDDPRIKSTIEETARINNSGTLPTIRLNGSESTWRCFGDQSGRCR